jgi:hypothetical protein
LYDYYYSLSANFMRSMPGNLPGSTKRDAVIGALGLVRLHPKDGSFLADSNIASSFTPGKAEKNKGTGYFTLLTKGRKRVLNTGRLGVSEILALISAGEAESVKTRQYGDYLH